MIARSALAANSGPMKATVEGDKSIAEKESEIFKSVLAAYRLRRLMTAAGLHFGTVAQAALDIAIAEYPGHRLTLRKGAMLIREHPPNKNGG